MTAGFQVYNSHGTLVADVNDVTMGFRGKYLVTVPSGAGALRYVDIEVPNCDMPSFAFRPTSYGRNCFAEFTPKPGTPTTMQIRVWTGAETIVEDGNPVYQEAINTASFQVWIYHFDRPGNDGNYGLQLFNAAGEITFNSNYPPARVLKGFSTDDLTSYSPALPAIIPSNRSYIASLNRSPDGWIELWAREMFRFESMYQVRFQEMFYTFSTAISPTTAYERYTGIVGGIVIDVSNM